MKSTKHCEEDKPVFFHEIEISGVTVC
jgi:hypothetical protein